MDACGDHGGLVIGDRGAGGAGALVLTFGRCVEEQNLLNSTFQAARHQKRALVCPFFTAGYPDLAASAGLLRTAQEAGCGCVEWGIPFSDPVADGPVIQASFTAALERGVTPARALEAVGEARKNGVTIPVVAMVSFSIVFRHGVEIFCQRCRENGVNGLIIPDLPLEEAPAVVKLARHAGLGSCLLVSPATPARRRAEITRLCDGFVYYLSVAGITGERQKLPADMADNLAQMRRETDQPICVGFGIATPAQAAQVAQLADGVIVGSAIIRRLTECGDTGSTAASCVGPFLRELVAAVDGRQASAQPV